MARVGRLLKWNFSSLLGIFANLWFGALLERVGSPLRVAVGLALALVALHLLAGNLGAQDPFWHTLDSAYIGLMTWLLLYGGSRTDAELRASSLEIDADQWRRRGPTRFAARLETTLALAIGLSLASISWFVLEAAGDESSYGAGARAVIFLRWVLDGAVLFHLGAMILRHRRWLHGYIDTELGIDLLHVDRLAIVSNAFVMWLALLAGIVAMPLLLFAFLREANPYEQVRIFSAVALGLVVAGLLFTPILRTRHRVIEARENQRARATAGLRGEPVERGELAFRCAGTHYSAAELLGYLQFLDSVWEWPIRRNLARIGFYALIPPTAWVLSALIEITISGQLQ